MRKFETGVTNQIERRKSLQELKEEEKEEGEEEAGQAQQDEEAVMAYVLGKRARMMYSLCRPVQRKSRAIPPTKLATSTNIKKRRKTDVKRSGSS